MATFDYNGYWQNMQIGRQRFEIKVRYFSFQYLMAFWIYGGKTPIGRILTLPSPFRLGLNEKGKERFRSYQSETLTLFDMGFFWTVSYRGGGGEDVRALHHNFFVTVPMIMKFGTGVKLDEFYT